MALLVVVLLTGMILIVMVSISASMSMGARQGGVDERAAYQALNAAESGVNTFEVRVKERLKTVGLPNRCPNQSQLLTWLDPLKTYPYDGGIKLSFDNLIGASCGWKFDVVSVGEQNGGTKKVLQGFELKSGALDFDFRPRAALTSLPPINANGSADVTGTANTGKVTEVAGLTASLTPTFDLPVRDASGLRVGDYFKIGSTTYRVNTVTDNATGNDALNVTALNVPSPTSINVDLNSDLILSLNAVGAQYNTGSDPMTIKASNAGDFVPGETVTVGSDKAKVTAIDKVNQTVTLDWVSGFSGTLSEGTTIFRDIAAMRSAESIDPKHNKLESYDMSPSTGATKVADCPTATTCKGANDKVLEEGMKEGQSFFTKMILGLTDAELDEAVPLSSSLTPMNDEVRRIPAANFDEVIKNGNSSGILIVDGDINTNINGNTTFNGFIYFRGNQGGKFNGNLTVNGAIAVRGGPIEGLTSDDTATNITGSLDLNYDAVQLRKQMLNSFGVPSIKAQKNTWRQQ
ncbi:hypothetical protein [Deinococcus reticulitermitis]|uniref:hypothetical protein n=1 Tax=Deinococcus reticulitermitis TaxID=856736 RepID=UPI000B895D07|nr:hypothetical protein [Deinococcus reticulitermitis]